jgi:type IV secretion system protein VirD4
LRSTEKELKEAGLFAGEGIVIGQTVDGQLLQHNGPEHALVFAPPRSGKGVGLVIPTLLAWKGISQKTGNTWNTFIFFGIQNM